MDRSISTTIIIIFNSIPIFGVAFYNWQPFEAFWFFWVETLIMAVFNTVRIIFSQGQPATVDASLPLVFHFGKGITYLLIRFGVFLFYSLFIIVFIGFIANAGKDKSTVLSTILFQNTFFNMGLLISITSQGYYLINDFFRNRAFITSTPGQYNAIFDGRQIVVHVAIVLGGMIAMFLMRNTAYGNLGAVVIISLLCICKCIYDVLENKQAVYKTV